METKIIACPQNASELESLSKFVMKQASSNLGVVFALKPSNNLSLELFQSVSEQSSAFELFVAQESDTCDSMIVKALEKCKGCDVLILRSMQFEGWNFLLELIGKKKGTVKVVYLKQVEQTKMQLFLNNAAVWFAKYLYGIHLYEGSIAAVLIDHELIHLAQTFPGKTNLLLKTNSFFGYKKLGIETEASFFPTLYHTKKDLIMFFSLLASFASALFAQILVNALAGNLVAFNIVMLIVNVTLLICTILAFSSYTLRRRVGKLIL